MQLYPHVNPILSRIRKIDLFRDYRIMQNNICARKTCICIYNYTYYVDSMVEKTVPHVVNRGLGLKQFVPTYACPDAEQSFSKEQFSLKTVAIQ